MKNFNKIYEAFFKKRNHVISSGKPDLELLDYVLEELKLPSNKDNTDLLNKLVLEFSKQKLPQKLFSRYNKLSIDNLIAKGNLISPEPVQVNIKPLNSSFEDIVKSFSKVVANDKLRRVMEGVYLNSKAKEIVATDAFNLIVTPFKFSGKSLIIDPKTNLKKIGKDKPLYKGKYEIITGSYPDYKRVIPNYTKQSISFELLPFLSQVKAIEKLSNFFIETGRFVIRLSAKAQRIYLKPAVLSKLLTAMAEQGVEHFQFTWADENPSTQPILLKALKSSKTTNLTMPFLLDEDDKDYAYIEFDLEKKTTGDKTKKRIQIKEHSINVKNRDKRIKALSLKAKAIKLKLQLLQL